MARRRRAPFGRYRTAWRIIWLALLRVAAWVGYAFVKGRTQDLPWTPLDLAQPGGEGIAPMSTPCG